MTLSHAKPTYGTARKPGGESGPLSAVPTNNRGGEVRMTSRTKRTERRASLRLFAEIGIEVEFVG